MANTVQQKVPAATKSNGFGRFLYTQNPFYLISCGFVLYGLQVAAAAMGDQLTRASFLTSSLASYTTLMAVTAIAVVRWGKIWQDARTILLVVVIGQIAYSIAVDQLCISNTPQAAMLLGLGALGSFLITECVLRLCRIRFPFWYRLPYYVIVNVFYLFPIVAGHLQATQSGWTNWSALVFSMLVSAGLMLLTPAVRSGKALAKDNGTPWDWPLFPLSMFFILAVLAGLRSYAIWMSFGSLRGGVSFDPLLLMPLILAGMVLVVEWAIAHERPNTVTGIVAFAPLTLICGVSSFARHPQPIDVGLSEYGGSAMTVALYLLIGFYAYTWVRGLKSSGAVTAILFFALGIVGEEPTTLEAQGVGRLAMMVAGCAVLYVLCQLKDARESTWLGFTAMTGVAIIRIADHFNQGDWGIGFAGTWVILMFMLIGWMFDSNLSRELRRMVALSLFATALVAIFAAIFQDAGSVTIAAMLFTTFLSTGYFFAIMRRAWIYVASSQAIALAATVAISSIDGAWFGAMAGNFWQLKTGAVCFCIGVVITSAKTGVFQEKWKSMSVAGKLDGLRSGF